MFQKNWTKMSFIKVGLVAATLTTVLPQLASADFSLSGLASGPFRCMQNGKSHPVISDEVCQALESITSNASLDKFLTAKAKEDPAILFQEIAGKFVTLQGALDEVRDVGMTFFKDQAKQITNSQEERIFRDVETNFYKGVEAVSKEMNKVEMMLLSVRAITNNAKQNPNDSQAQAHFAELVSANGCFHVYADENPKICLPASYPLPSSVEARTYALSNLHKAIYNMIVYTGSGYTNYSGNVFAKPWTGKTSNTYIPSKPRNYEFPGL